MRIWQGSDFNVDSELSNYIGQERSPLVKLLSLHRPLKPLVAQRHSYQKGTLRYFERHYLDNSQDLSQLVCSSVDADGFVGYWVGDEVPHSVSATTRDGKPLVILSAANLDVLRIRTLEYVALENIRKTAKELQVDGVARKEVNYRLLEAETYLDETLNQSFSIGVNQHCWIQGEVETLNNITDFNSKLSDICDRVYYRSPILWNELINRRDLTSQGAKARRELIQAMLEHIALLLETYFIAKGIDFYPLGSTTFRREATARGIEPDECYCFNSEKPVPDLAIEIVVTSGGIDDLLIYQGLGVPEVWFWRNNQFFLYYLRGNQYEQITKSELFSDLDLELLANLIMSGGKPKDLIAKFRESFNTIN